MPNYNTTLQLNNTSLQEIKNKINNLPNAGEGGVDTSDATAIASEIFAGETAYVAEGKVTGTFTIEDELNTQDNLIAQISTLVQQKANPQGGTDTSDATATASDILSGKTAYVDGEKITGTIPSKATATYTPSTSNQTIASGTYLIGTQTIAGDANLKAENIAEGVSIFGVTGTYSGSGSSGGGSIETCYCQISYDAPALNSCTATYTNASMQRATKTFNPMDGARIELVKGTTITLAPWSTTNSTSGDCTKIFANGACGVYFIAGESTIVYE